MSTASGVVELEVGAVVPESNEVAEESDADGWRELGELVVGGGHRSRCCLRSDCGGCQVEGEGA